MKNDLCLAGGIEKTNGRLTPDETGQIDPFEFRDDRLQVLRNHGRRFCQGFGQYPFLAGRKQNVGHVEEAVIALLQVIPGRKRIRTVTGAS